MTERGYCEKCGSPTEWDDNAYCDEDEDGFISGDYEAFCDYCYEVMAERDRARREWAEYHPGEPCPEVELPQFTKKVRSPT